MQDYVGRTGAMRWDYAGTTAELARGLDTLRELIVRCGPSAAFFIALCAAWALVFGVALR